MLMLLLDVVPLGRPRLPQLPEGVYVGAVWRSHASLHPTHNHAAGEQRPCAGKLRFTEVDGPVPMVECDRCDYEAGVPRRRLTP